jgi:YD repeat-containing protein
VTTDLEYTPRGELALERTTIGGASYEIAYTYDAGGKLAATEAPSGTTIETAYAGSRPKIVTITSGTDSQEVRDLEFLPFGPRTRAELPPEDPVTGDNIVLSTRQYDLRHQVTEIDVTSPAGTVLDLSYTYTYANGSPGPADAGPHLDRVVDHRDASQSRFYFYDDLERLWKATDLAGTPLHTYLYDANGNRIQQTVSSGTTSYAYDTGTDRLAQTTGAEALHYSHDPYGSRIWAGGTTYAGTPSHVYDESNRLVEVRDPSTFAVLGTYAYDVFGRRVRKVAGGVTTVFLFDAEGHLLEERKPGTSPVELRDYVYVEGEIVGLVDHAASTSFAWIHTDRSGAPVAATRAALTGAASLVWRASYPPYGIPIVDEDPDGDTERFILQHAPR